MTASRPRRYLGGAPQMQPRAAAGTGGVATDPALLLYSTAGCHLCVLAEQLLAGAGLRWELVDIAEDPVLVERYGTRIPVLAQRLDGRELDWPFTSASLRAFLAGS